MDETSNLSVKETARLTSFLRMGGVGLNSGTPPGLPTKPFELN
jgi:hypothetical protein